MSRAILLILLFFSVVALSAESFEDASRKASELEKLHGDYRSKMLRSYTRQAGKEVIRCFSKHNNTDQHTFNIVFRIIESGQVEASWVNIDTPISKCFKEAMLELQFINPPIPVYYYEASMSFKP